MDLCVISFGKDEEINQEKKGRASRLENEGSDLAGSQNVLQSPIYPLDLMDPRCNKSPALQVCWVSPEQSFLSPFYSCPVI